MISKLSLHICLQHFYTCLVTFLSCYLPLHFDLIWLFWLSLQCLVKMMSCSSLPCWLFSISMCLQYDYMERLDGKEKWSVIESPRERRSIQTVVQNEAIFVQYLDPGTWHLAFYNDGKEKEPVSFSTVALGTHLQLLFTH